jgi:hypothetical protein
MAMGTAEDPEGTNYAETIEHHRQEQTATEDLTTAFHRHLSSNGVEP